MKIYIEGYYGHANLGDDYILLSILKTIHGITATDADIFVAYKSSIRECALSNKIFQQYVHCGVPFQKYKLTGSRWKKMIDFFCFICSCDRWIIGGGGLFPKEDTKGLMLLLLRMLIGKIAKTRICFYGIEINPVKKRINQHIWRLMGMLADLFVTRNKDTAMFLNNIGIKRVESASDATFSLKVPYENEIPLFLPDVYDVWALGMPWTEEEMENLHYKDRYSKLCFQLESILESTDVPVVLIPFSELDRNFVKDVITMYSGKNKITVIEEDIPFYKKRGVFIKARQCLCMRFHSLIFALFTERPFVCISYSPKSSLLLKECDLDECCVEFGVRDTEFFYREFDLDIELLKEKCKYETISEKTFVKIKKASKTLKDKAISGENILKEWLVSND